MSERLCRLHERLIRDTRTAFTTEGTTPSRATATIHPTPAGLAWLRDWHRYRQEWLRLERQNLEPAQILRQRFGFILETPPDEEEPVTET